ncbi:368_t:CDS:2 [Ambispora gerdemannii]|uniref:368_t:CDS:1 n=1 Tax=Ambispora gerdemannii TaxID=144530 RepID=A0A9N8VPM0_9GLOM|nr:368_t:CDS:2 [Ambispora gerdemannii]
MDQTNSSIGSSSESTEIRIKTGFSMSIQSAGVKRLEKSSAFVSEKTKKRRVNVDNRDEEFDHQEQTSKRHVCVAAVKYAPTTAHDIISVRSLTGTKEDEDVRDLEKKDIHDEIKPPQDEDQKLRQLALNELMKASDPEDLTENSQNLLVLPQKENSYTQETKVKADDAESFRQLIENHPDEKKIDYGRVPIQEFGAALLRGMGWKPGMSIGKNQSNKAVKLYEPQHRPALLGLGASVLPTSKTQERRSKYTNGEMNQKLEVEQTNTRSSSDPDQKSKSSTGEKSNRSRRRRSSSRDRTSSGSHRSISTKSYSDYRGKKSSSKSASKIDKSESSSRSRRHQSDSHDRSSSSRSAKYYSDYNR